MLRASLRSRSRALPLLLATLALPTACSGNGDGSPGTPGGGSTSGSTGARGNAGGNGNPDGNDGGGSGVLGFGGDLFDTDASTGMIDPPPPDGGFKACTGLAVQGEQVVKSAPLDIYLVFDRTASMGQDCAFAPGTNPPVASKACYATYAIAEYFMSVKAEDDTHLAFQFMSLSNDDCDGVAYGTPLIDMTPLPVPATHPLIQAISNETFKGGFGTHIEGALRGIASYTTAHDKQVGPTGRTTIGVLMTDGDPNGCDGNIDNLAKIVADHTAATKGAVRTFFIGETGATLANLEKYAVAGGAAAHPDFCGKGTSPCHYWDVGDGKPEALASAMASIVGQATVAHPIPCTFKVPEPPDNQKLDPALVNVQFTDKAGNPSDIYKVDSKAACDAAVGGWYYDDPLAPTQILLCPTTCSTVTVADDANMTVEFGCASQKPPIR